MTRKTWFLVAALALAAAACGAAVEESEAPVETEEGFAPGAKPAGSDLEVVEEATADVEGAGFVSSGLPGVGPNVIKMADLRLEVGRGSFKDALQTATRVAADQGGFVISSTVKGEDARRGSLVIRVPSDRFERALTDLRDLGKVEGETVSSEDVSQEFVDLEARLRNLEAQEAVLLRLMDRAQTISDTIKVQRELTGIQLEIERITGRLRFLENQTSFGTISVALVEQGVAAKPSAGAIQRGWERATDAFLAIASGLIASLGVALPIAALALAVWLVGRRLRPRPVRSP